MGHTLKIDTEFSTLKLTNFILIIYELTNTDRRRSVSKCCRGISLPSTNSSKCCLVSCLLMNLSLLCQLNLIYNNSINHTLVVCIGNGLHYLSRLFLLFSQFWIILFRSALCRFEYHFFFFLVLSTGANLIYFTQNFQLTSYITSHLIMTVILYITTNEYHYHYKNCCEMYM